MVIGPPDQRIHVAAHALPTLTALYQGEVTPWRSLSVVHREVVTLTIDSASVPPAPGRVYEPAALVLVEGVTILS